MSTPSGPGGPARPMRLAGLILIGVAIVATGLGVFTLTSNGSGQSAASYPPSSTLPKPTTTQPKPTTTTHPPTTTSSYPPGHTTTTVPAPSQTSTPPGQPAPVPVRVLNNSMIKGLADQAANDFRGAGFDVVEVGNYAQGTIPTSTVYYSPLPGEQQTATALGQQFNLKVAPRFPGIAYASPGVIVIVTNDFHPTGK